MDPLMKAMAMGAVAVLFCCPPATQETATSPIDDPDAYLVYASLLPNEWTVRVAHAKTLVFQEETETVAYPRCMPSGKPLETDWLPVVDSFKTANSGVRTILPGDVRMPAYVVVSSAEIRASFKDVPNDLMFGWTGFYRRYPDSGGYLQVSAVGFDPSKTRAMVYMEHHCGSLCGGGMHHFLEKVAGVWREVKLPGVTQCLWVS